MTEGRLDSKTYYGAIDGMRTIACFGIAMMHIEANNKYEISGFLYETVIPSFTNFVFLFMTVSAFGMCCGYYEKIVSNRISVSTFYSRRFKKVWPFFAILVVLDVILSPSINTVYEAFADLTLLFGFLPEAGNIEVIGVGWFIGLIFVFYLIFPFFCFLLENKRRAWGSFIISLVYNFACTNYFNAERKNIIYCGCFFLAGGLIYQYKETVSSWGKKVKSGQWIMLLGVFGSFVVYYLLTPVLNDVAMPCLLVSVALLIYAVSVESGVLNNRFMHFFGDISMEIYLSHMVVFRVLEKICANTIVGDGWLQYVFTVLMTLGGATVFAVVIKKLLK